MTDILLRSGIVNWRSRAARRFALICLGLALSSGPAWAQISANDGYAPDGSYRLQVEITPYL
jgi:hypothetical protein